jgi:hypothetical protein
MTGQPTLRGKPANCTPSRFYYVILYEGTAHRRSVTGAIARLASEPKEGLEELRGLLSSKKQSLLIGSAIDRQHRTLRHQVRSLILQLSDFVAIEMCGKQEAFKF